MRGTKTSIARTLLFFSAASLSVAATPDYFPLQPGNSWVYRGTSRWFNSQPKTIEVEAMERLGDREYARVNFFGRTVYLRAVDGGLKVTERAGGTEDTWLQFDSPEGRSFPTAIEQCTSGASVASTAAKVKTPAGEWDNAIQFSFTTSCADAGVTSMYFVPGVGPVVYETTSIAGPVRYELTYTRAGAVAAEAAQTAFTVALDAPTYQAGDAVDIQVRLTLRNTHPQPVTLQFPSSQRFDLRVWNDKGEGVYIWSADKLFAQAATSDTFTGERTYAFTATIPNLPPGRYAAEAWLTTGPREYVGIVGFNAVR